MAVYNRPILDPRICAPMLKTKPHRYGPPWGGTNVSVGGGGAGGGENQPIEREAAKRFNSVVCGHAMSAMTTARLSRQPGAYLRIEMARGWRCHVLTQAASERGLCRAGLERDSPLKMEPAVRSPCVVAASEMRAGGVGELWMEGILSLY